MDYESVKVPVEALATYLARFAGRSGCVRLLAWFKAEFTGDLEKRIAALEAQA
jgi:hypothetical protein